MTTPPQDDQEEPFFITEEIQAAMIEAGYVFEPPAHLQKRRDRDLFSAQSGETPTEAIMKNQSKG